MKLLTNIDRVARCARAWIETTACVRTLADGHVARCARAWIETISKGKARADAIVARCARAWIETLRCTSFFKRRRRPLRAGVD